MKTPLLTVITPIYNGEKFIESCIQSVIAQNCPDAEHLIIDGCSTDRTLDIIERHARNNPHIRWISEKDTGQSNAMNKGITLSRGQIIGFLNSDDYYQPNLLPKIIRIFQTLPIPSFLVGNCNVLNDREEILYVNKPSRLSFINILIGGVKNQYPYNPSAYFYHKSLHDKVGFYDEFDHYTMDLDFILRAVKTANIKYVDETWGNFRYIEGTKTFLSMKRGQLELNKTQVNNLYLAELPAIQRWWVLIARFLCVEHKHNYYMRRLLDCLKDPKEILRIMARKLRR